MFITVIHVSIKKNVIKNKKKEKKLFLKKKKENEFSFKKFNEIVLLIDTFDFMKKSLLTKLIFIELNKKNIELECGKKPKRIKYL